MIIPQDGPASRTGSQPDGKLEPDGTCDGAKGQRPLREN